MATKWAAAAAVLQLENNNIGDRTNSTLWFLQTDSGAPF